MIVEEGTGYFLHVDLTCGCTKRSGVLGLCTCMHWSEVQLFPAGKMVPQAARKQITAVWAGLRRSRTSPHQIWKLEAESQKFKLKIRLEMSSRYRVCTLLQLRVEK
jgi:hypothetical protein